MKIRKKSKTAVFLPLAAAFILIVGTTALGANGGQKGKTIEQSGVTAPTLSDNRAYTDSQSISGPLDDTVQELKISLDICEGGVVVLPASSRELTADYDSQSYNMQLANQDGVWVMSVSGKKDDMGNTYVQLHIPDIKCEMDIHVLDGSFLYDLPANRQDAITITAADSSLKFTSDNEYENSAISLTATDQDYILYGHITYPNYFTETQTGFTYTHGTGANQISITLTGYTNIDFTERS